MGNHWEFFQNKFIGLFYNLTNKQIKWRHKVSIRKFSELIGNLVASFPAGKIEQLFCRNLDRLC